MKKALLLVVLAMAPTGSGDAPRSSRARSTSAGTCFARGQRVAPSVTILRTRSSAPATASSRTSSGSER